MAADIKFFLDENISPQVAEQLQRKGIEAVSVREVELLGDTDDNLLVLAIEKGYVLCTQDIDFLQMVASGTEHTGIIFGHSRKMGIGDWVNGLERIYTDHTMGLEYMRNHVVYL